MQVRRQGMGFSLGLGFRVCALVGLVASILASTFRFQGLGFDL